VQLKRTATALRDAMEQQSTREIVRLEEAGRAHQLERMQLQATILELRDAIEGRNGTAP
jgi:hypothetical protein